jgi:hypothetical protein
MDHYTVVRLPPTSADEQSDFKDCMREQFPFMTVRFTFTSEYTYIRFRYPDYATTAAQLTGGDIVETEVDSLLIHDVFGDMTLPEPALLHQHGACNQWYCEICAELHAEEESSACDYCRSDRCDGYDCRRCDNCGSLSCQGRCEDERAYEDEDDHGPHCRCCGEADEEVGMRYAGYCSYTCAHDDDY